MTIRLAFFLICGVALCACDGSDSDDDGPPADPPSAQCQASAQAVTDAFTRPEGTVLFRGVSPAPVATRGRSLDTRLPRVVVTDERIVIDDVQVIGESPPAALAAELGMRATLAAPTDPGARNPHGGSGSHGGGWANAINLYAPGETTVSRLGQAIAEIDPSLRFDLVVQHAEDGTPAEPNPPAWLATELARLRLVPDLDARRVRFRELFDRAVGECTEARAHTGFVFGRDPAVPTSARPSGSVADALLACRCDGVETDALVAIGILTGPPNRHPLNRLSFTRVTEPGERVITAIASDDVNALVTQLSAARDPLRVYFPPAEEGDGDGAEEPEAGAAPALSPAAEAAE